VAHSFGGGADLSLTARLGLTAAEAVEWSSDTSLRGLAPAGVHQALDVTISVSRTFVSSWVDPSNKRFYDVLMFAEHQTHTQMLSFDTPVIHTSSLNASLFESKRFLGASTLNTPSGRESDSVLARDSMFVDIVGSGLGVYTASPVARVGGTGCERTEWMSSTSIQCWAARGAERASSRHAVTVLGQPGLSSDVFSYDAPQVSIMMLDPQTPVTTELGFYSTPTLRLLGAEFGTFDQSFGARIRESSGEATTWLSSSHISCKQARGIAAYTIFKTTAGIRTSSATKAFTYFRKIYEMITEGGQVIPQTSLTMTGTGFGINDYTSRVRIGDFACEASAWVSDSAVRCKVSSQSLRPDKVTITVLRDEAYWVPILMKNTNGGASGRTSITVIGMAFREFDPTGSIRLGGTACITTTWVAETTMVCLLAPGTGTKLELSVTIRGVPDIDENGTVTEKFNTGTLEEAFQYDEPVIQGETSSMVLSCAESAAGASVEQPVECQRGALPAGSVPQPANYPCTLPWIWRQRWYRNVSCVTPGGATGRIHELADIHVMARSNLPASGNIELTLLGQNFAITDFSGQLLIGDTAGAITQWLSDTSTYSLTRSGVRNQLSLSKAICNICPYTSGLEPPRGSDCYFQRDHRSPECSNFTIKDANGLWLGESNLVRQVVGETSRAFSYDLPAPVVHIEGSHTRGHNAPGYSANVLNVTVVGSAFSLSDYSSAMRIGGEGERQVDLSDAVLQRALVAANLHRLGHVPESLNFGPGLLYSPRGDPIFIHLREGYCPNNTLALNFSHCVTFCHILDAQTAAAKRATILAGMVWVEDTTLHPCVDVQRRSRGSEGGTAAELSVWQSDSVIVTKVASGVAGSSALVATIGLQFNTVTKAVSYDRPSAILETPPAQLRACRQRGQFGCTLGNFPVRGRTIEVVTTSLSNHDYTATLRYFSAAERSSWISSSALVCKVSRGHVSTMAAHVSIGLHVQTRTSMLSYDRPQAYSIRTVTPLSIATKRLANAPSLLHAHIEVRATDLALYAASLSASAGRTTMERTVWVSSSFLHARLPLALMPVGNKIIITQGTQADSSLQLLSYDQVQLGVAAPTAYGFNVGNFSSKRVPTTARPQNTWTTGNANVTVLGAAMGTESYSPSIRIHGGLRSTTAAATACATTVWSAETALVCRCYHLSIYRLLESSVGCSPRSGREAYRRSPRCLCCSPLLLASAARLAASSARLCCSGRHTGARLAASAARLAASAARLARPPVYLPPPTVSGLV